MNVIFVISLSSPDQWSSKVWDHVLANDCTGIWAGLQRNSVACWFEMFAQNMHQKGLYQTTLSAKKASASGGLRPPDPYQVLYSNKI